MDDRLTGLFGAATTDTGTDGLALVAVGGYGRSELSPFSDVDVVLVHANGARPDAVTTVAEAIWYPLWDDGVDLDHAVRGAGQMRSAASVDVRAAAGMLDARHVAGDAQLTATLRSAILADWRKDARKRLPDLRDSCRTRLERSGEVAHATIPNLKESAGGLRDAGVLRALVATWLVHVPRDQADVHRQALLDVRDALHQVGGRRSDRLAPELVPDVATALGVDPAELLVDVRDHGRRIAHLLHLTWRRIDQVTARRSVRARLTLGPALVPLAPGVAELAGEVVLTDVARPGADPLLALRVAATAAEHGLLISPVTADRLTATAPLEQPWPDEARRLLVRLLGAGPGLVPVWETLDQVGIVDLWLPEWAQIRFRTSEAVVHRHTVDRHSVQTCVEAAALVRDVARPDLLVVAALLHDIGKGRPGDHSEVGAPVAKAVASRWGFAEADTGVIAHLVRQHLLLPSVATRRDLADPSTPATVLAQCHSVDTLDLLAALTEADAKSAGRPAWTAWRAGLIRQLVTVCRAQLRAEPVRLDSVLTDIRETRPPDHEASGFALWVDEVADGSRLRVRADDRIGLLATVAGAWALAGLGIRAARATAEDGVAESVWDVTTPELDPAILALGLRRVMDGSLDPADRFAATTASSGVPPRVALLADASQSATVLEVRAGDRVGLIWTIARAIADQGVDVRSAHLDTLGPQSADVFYLVGSDGRGLAEVAAADVRTAVEAALHSEADRLGDVRSQPD